MSIQHFALPNTLQLVEFTSNIVQAGTSLSSEQSALFSNFVQRRKDSGKKEAGCDKLHTC